MSSSSSLARQQLATFSSLPTRSSTFLLARQVSRAARTCLFSQRVSFRSNSQLFCLAYLISSRMLCSTRYFPSFPYSPADPFFRRSREASSIWSTRSSKYSRNSLNVSASSCSTSDLILPASFSEMRPFSSISRMRLIARSCSSVSGQEVLIFSTTLLYFRTMIGIQQRFARLPLRPRSPRSRRYSLLAPRLSLPKCSRVPSRYRVPIWYFRTKSWGFSSNCDFSLQNQSSESSPSSSKRENFSTNSCLTSSSPRSSSASAYSPSPSPSSCWTSSTSPTFSRFLNSPLLRLSSSGCSPAMPWMKTLISGLGWRQSLTQNSHTFPLPLQTISEFFASFGNAQQSYAVSPGRYFVQHATTVTPSSARQNSSNSYRSEIVPRQREGKAEGRAREGSVSCSALG